MEERHMSESGLRLWYNDSDWVVAASPEDAWKALEEATGLTIKDFDLTEARALNGFWREQTKPLSMLEYEGQPLADAPKKMPAEIVAAHGRGYFGSSEW